MNKPINIVFLSDWVTEKKLAEITGLSATALEHYRRAKKVIKDVHYVIAANKRIMWNVKEFNEWLVSKSEMGALESGSCGTAKSSTKQRPLKTTLQV